jgi:hypothetical protein
MLVLFDNGTPRTLARFQIDHHTVTEARARGWEALENGDLLREAEASGFDVLITTDKNLRYQQNLKGGKMRSSCWAWAGGASSDTALSKSSMR